MRRFPGGGGWKGVTIDVADKGQRGIPSMQVAAARQKVEIGVIEVKASAGTRRWDF